MPSITSWMRLEPRSRNAEMNTSLQARIYDPLWLLARQWQFGEFQGEDNGSPVMARWRGETTRLNRYLPGAAGADAATKAQSFDGRAMPLETLVERERVRPDPAATEKPEKWLFAVRAGQHFLRMLDQQPLSKSYRELFRSKFPFSALTADQRSQLDTDSLSFLDLMGPRVPDGRKLYAVLRPQGGGAIKLPADLVIAPADVAEVQVTAASWIQWCDALFSEPGGSNLSWSAERMEYSLSVAGRFADTEKVLTAQEYFDGHLDWQTFNLDDRFINDRPISLGAAADAQTITRTTIPAPVSFRGMPAPRFWEFEDARVDFGSVDAGPTDLARMLLVEFALAYGNDWFVIPIELEVGSLCRTRSLVVTDTFGVRTLIKSSSELPAPHSLWRMFQLSRTRQPGTLQPLPATNLFFLPPALLKSLESRPIEEVLFLRDEMANMAWGVERIVESAAEQPLNRFEAYLEQKRKLTQPAPSAAATAPDVLRYRLSTEVPDYWIPLLPVKVGSGLRLRRAAVLKLDGSQGFVPAQGRILESGQQLSLFEEEVPREGVRVTRSYQFTRWIDGSSHFWIGRRKAVGRGEGSSGLQFDKLSDGREEKG